MWVEDLHWKTVAPNMRVKRIFNFTEGVVWRCSVEKVFLETPPVAASNFTPVDTAILDLVPS